MTLAIKRAAEKRAKPEKTKEPERVSPDDLEWLRAARGQYNRAAQAAQSAKGAMAFADGFVSRKYGLEPEDELDLESGAIIRRKP